MAGAITPQDTTIETLTIKSNSFEVSTNIGILGTTALAKPSKVV